MVNFWSTFGIFWAAFYFSIWSLWSMVHHPLTHRIFWFATRGQCIKGKKLDCFEHNHIFCFKLQCASIVVLLCTAIWWKLKDAVVHCVLWQDWVKNRVMQVVRSVQCVFESANNNIILNKIYVRIPSKYLSMEPHNYESNLEAPRTLAETLYTCKLRLESWMWLGVFLKNESRFSLDQELSVKISPELYMTRCLP